MKKLNKKIFAILLIVLTVNLNAQNEDNPWAISAGVNAIDIYPVGTHSQQQGENLEEFLASIEKDQGKVVFLAMSVPDYELMAYNTQELKRYINELKEVVVYYRKVTTNKSGE